MGQPPCLWAGLAKTCGIGMLGIALNVWSACVNQLAMDISTDQHQNGPPGHLNPYIPSPPPPSPWGGGRPLLHGLLKSAGAEPHQVEPIAMSSFWSPDSPAF